MVEPQQRQIDDVRLSHRPLPDDVRRRRELQRVEDARIEKVARPRMDAQLAACRMALDQLKAWHRQIADETDLELDGYSRASAIWLLAGRSLGLIEALLAQARAGIDTEVLVTGRALHEADHMLLVFTSGEGEDLVRQWLDDEGRHGYVKPKAARQAQQRFEEALEKHLDAMDLPRIGRTDHLADELYDRMSRVAHSRRSTCLSALWREGREFSYGYHPSPIRRAYVVEWASSMVVEVLNAVGDALRAFYGQGFFTEHIAPLIRSILAVQETAPLDRASLLRDAG